MVTCEGILSMAYRKTAVTPLLTHWSYCNLALSHRYDGVYSGVLLWTACRCSCHRCLLCQLLAKAKRKWWIMTKKPFTDTDQIPINQSLQFLHITYETYAIKACTKFVLMTRKWITTKWNLHHVGNVNGNHLMEWAQHIKATKSEESRPNVERQKCKPSNQYPFSDQGYRFINYS